MALFDDEDEQDEDTTESGGWDVDEESTDSHPDPATGSAEATDPLADLDTASLSHGAPNGTLKRAVDREAGVVVYAYKNGNAGGLSTVPLSATEFAADDEE